MGYRHVSGWNDQLWRYHRDRTAPTQSWRRLSCVGEVTEVNVWGQVLSERDIQTQNENCTVNQGALNKRVDFDYGVEGEVFVFQPQSNLFSESQDAVTIT